MSANTPADLKRIYEARFERSLPYRRRIWSVLIGDVFQKYVGPSDAVLDLGCGYGEFINQVHCDRKIAMDLNPAAPRHLDKSVTFLEQDCSTRWKLDDGTLNVVFTSNFFEHLPEKAALGRTLDEAHRCLASGGRLIALGPNIKYLPGKYWDFWDHHLPLTEKSIREALMTRGFKIEYCAGKFLPYTTADTPQSPILFLRIYLKIPLVWPLFGKQFLVVAQKP